MEPRQPPALIDSGLADASRREDPALETSRAAVAAALRDGAATRTGAPLRWRDRLLQDVLSLMFRHRLLFVGGAFLAAAAGGLSTLVIEPWYIARASIYPLSTASPLGALAFPGAAGLIGTLGLNPGQGSSFPIYEKVLVSRELVGELLTTPLTDAGINGTLLDYLGIEATDATLRQYLAIEATRGHLAYEVDAKTGIATVSFTDANPRVAALLANRAVDLLNRFDVATASNQAREKRAFVEERLQESEGTLTRAEHRLERFRLENLRIGNAPDLLLEQARLQREVEIEQQVYLTLRKELELARIDEHRSLPVVNVIERAVPPVYQAGPSLLRNTALGGILGGLLMTGIFVLRALGPRRLWGQLARLGA